MPAIPKFLHQSIQELDHKYSIIKQLQLQRYKAGSKTEWSMSKGIQHDRNRYGNIVPYDKTRVKLQVNSGYDDYINASHITIDLHENSIQPKRYIASQGPTEDTTDLFWQMCYKEVKGDNIVIVMVTPLVENGFEKCFKYWPEKKFQLGGEHMFGNNLELEKQSSEVIDGEFVMTHLKLTDTLNGVSKNVYHLYYDQWRDFSKPVGLGPVKLLSEYANNYLSTQNDPIFVHCSAGVGRSGTFITLNYLLTCSNLFVKGEKLHNADDDLIEETVYQLRDQRLLMVERFEQFTFIYESLKKFYVEKFLEQ